jgi:16S rRNA pseudouridine516 synthase
MIRLDRLLVNMKFGSRKEVQDLIKSGAVLVDGKVELKKDRKLNPAFNKVLVFDEELYYQDEIILAINKPIGYLSANVDAFYPVVVDLIGAPYHRHDFKIAGRLDLDSEGLLILTTSGKTVHEITNPNKKIIKTYEVTTEEIIDEEMLSRLLEPIRLLDGNSEPYLTKAINISKTGEYTALISLDEGKFHQVKRMFRAIGYEVINLKRIQIGKYHLGNLEPGEYVEIKKDDIL